jgi:hypothetical protein
MSETDFGRWGALAARHMARWQPSTWAAIPEAERGRFFRDLDDEVMDAIIERERCLRPPPSLQETDPAEYLGQVRMARLTAEEEVLKELVYLPPEPGLESEADEPEIAENGGWVDRAWRDPNSTESDEEWQERQKAGTWRSITDPPHDPYQEEDSPA